LTFACFSNGMDNIKVKKEMYNLQIFIKSNFQTKSYATFAYKNFEK